MNNGYKPLFKARPNKNLVLHKIYWLLVLQKDSLSNAFLNTWLTKLQCAHFLKDKSVVQSELIPPGHEQCLVQGIQ